MPKPTPPVELNIDLGELPHEPVELFGFATVVNIACGGHAGSRESMRRAALEAHRKGTRVAAHPSYPDREGFGRRSRFCGAREMRASVVHQCAALLAAAREAAPSIAVVTMKPHGALYHDVAVDSDLAAAVIEAAAAALPDLSRIVGPPETAFEDIVCARGYTFVPEGFADRRYDETMKLLPRSRPDALITEPGECVSQALMLAKMARIETICVHGDTPNAVEIARAVSTALEREGLLARRDLRSS